MVAREEKYSRAFNARYMTYKEIAKSFIVSEHFDVISRNEHTILTGARGCGKTTLLKMLHPKALSEWISPEAKHFKENIPFFGIYIPADRQWISQLDAFKKNFSDQSEIVESVFRGVVNANILISTCDTFSTLIELNQCENSFEIDLSLKLIEHWKMPLPLPPNLYDIIIKLRVMVNEFNNIIGRKKSDIELPDICYSDFVDLVSISIDCFESINKKYSNPIHIKSKWALCFDELEITPEFLQKNIIGQNLRSRNQKIIFKLTSTPGLIEIFDQTNKQSPSELDDYTKLKLWVFDNRSQKDWRVFCEKYMSTILNEYYKKSIDLNILLGEHNYLEGLKSEETILFSKSKSKENSEFDEGGIMWYVMKLLQNFDKSFYDYLIRKNIDPLNPIASDRNKASSVHRKIKPIVLFRYYFTEESPRKGKNKKLRSRNINSFCHGKDFIFDIADGNPRAFANLVNDFISQVQFTNSGILKKIPISQQARIIELFSKNYAFLRIRNYPRNEIKNSDQLLWQLIDKIGKYFFNKLVLEDFNADPFILFYVDPKDNKMKSFIEIALESGAILKIEDEIPRVGIKRNIDVFRLSYSLYPKYRLPKIDYNPIDLKKILYPNEDAAPNLFNM
jgi:energy-coupling factor transporter ATP-binding protein EcfA2